MGFTGDFKISRRFRKISGFHVRFQDFTIDFGISREISRFHYRFQDFTEDFKISRKISRFQERFHSKCTRFQRVADPSVQLYSDSEARAAALRMRKSVRGTRNLPLYYVYAADYGMIDSYNEEVIFIGLAII